MGTGSTQPRSGELSNEVKQTDDWSDAEGTEQQWFVFSE